MKITVVGGGPGGLYFSILTKKAIPNCEINVYERNLSWRTFYERRNSWGIDVVK